MERNHLLVTLLSALLLASMALEGEAGASFHPRPRNKTKEQTVGSRMQGTKRDIEDHAVPQVEVGHRHAILAQVDVTPKVLVEEPDPQQNGEQLLWLFEDLLGLDGQGD